MKRESILELKLPQADGTLSPYMLRPATTWAAPANPPQWNRVAFAAAHVVADPLAAVDPWLTAAIGVLLTRLALSGARLFLLDEPDDALDANGAELVDAFLRSADATALVVTHNLALARRMDRLWFLDRGKLVEAGGAELLLGGDGPTARHFRLRSAA